VQHADIVQFIFQGGKHGLSNRADQKPSSRTVMPAASDGHFFADFL
jgi:hypothetical protein